MPPCGVAWSVGSLLPSATRLRLLSICLSRPSTRPSDTGRWLTSSRTLFMVYGSEKISQIRVYNPLIPLVQFAGRYRCVRCSDGWTSPCAPSSTIVPASWLRTSRSRRSVPNRFSQRLLAHPIIDRRDAKGPNENWSPDMARLLGIKRWTNRLRHSTSSVPTSSAGAVDRDLHRCDASNGSQIALASTPRGTSS